jgi:hypothetical protein
MFPFRQPDLRYRIQIVAPTPERTQELQQYVESALKQGNEAPVDDADKILTTGWLATAEEGLQFFKEITATEDSSLEKEEQHQLPL